MLVPLSYNSLSRFIVLKRSFILSYKLLLGILES